MSCNLQKGRRWRLAGSIILVALFGNLLLISGISVLEFLILNYIPANYAWQVKQATEQGNYPVALAVAKKRTATETYDFEARRLLARTSLFIGDSGEAVTILLESLDRARTIKGREVFSRGYNPALDLALLSQALTVSNRLEFASEMARAALDAFRLDTGTSAALLYKDKLPPLHVQRLYNPVITQPLNLTLFQLSPGVTLTPTGSLLFSRNSVARVALPTDLISSSTLCLQFHGSGAMGVGTFLAVKVDEEDLIQIYENEKDSRWVCVSLSASPARLTTTLSLRFLNDEYDPYTGADRNIEVTRIGLIKNSHAKDK